MSFRELWYNYCTPDPVKFSEIQTSEMNRSSSSDDEDEETKAAEALQLLRDSARYTPPGQVGKRFGLPPPPSKEIVPDVPPKLLWPPNHPDARPEALKPVQQVWWPYRPPRRCLFRPALPVVRFTSYSPPLIPVHVSKRPKRQCSVSPTIIEKPKMGIAPERIIIPNTDDWSGRTYYDVQSKPTITNRYTNRRIKNNIAVRKWRKKRHQMELRRDMELERCKTELQERDLQILILQNKIAMFQAWVNETLDKNIRL